MYIRNVSAFNYMIETHSKEAFDPRMNRKTSIGIIGCGTISSTYLKAARLFDILQVIACADIDMERAHRQGEKYGVPRVYTVEELLADPEVEIVVNLTVPNAHAEVALKAIAAGKAVYGEKPLATRRADGKAILDAAHATQVRVGNAPDTFLGDGTPTTNNYTHALHDAPPTATPGS